MKIKTSAKKGKLSGYLLKNWKPMGVIALTIAAFLGGLGFERYWRPAEFIEKNKNLIIKTDKQIAVELKRELGLYNANGLAAIFIDLPFESLMSIEQKRNEALQAGILLTSDDDFVPASMHILDAPPFDIKIRLKGDWVDHLNTEKWSFRIHVRDDNASVMGMRRFSLQAPQTRNYEKEWGFHQNLILEDILATRYFFVNVVINGEFKGIYALEESFTEDLLESQERREGVIIRFDEDLMWKNWENLNVGDAVVKKVVDQIGEFWLTTGVSSSEITPFRDTRISTDDVLYSELVAAIELLHSFSQGKLVGEEVFDLEVWGKFFAVTDLWGAGHATAWHNLRFYYNPVTGLLEPIAFDALPFEPSTLRDELAFPFASEGFIRTIFIIPGVQKTYVETLERITKPPYLKDLEQNIGAELEHYHQALSGPLETGIFGGIPPLVWDELHQRAAVLSKNLESPQPLQSNYYYVRIEGQAFLQLDITNLMILPVQVNELVIGEKTIPFNRSWCLIETCQYGLIANIDEVVIKENTDISFLIPLGELTNISFLSDIFFVKANIYGGGFITDNPVKSNYVPRGIETGVKPVKTLEEALADYPFLVEVEKGVLTILPGEWNVNGDLVIPKGNDLLITKSTTLKFAENSVLFVYGKINLLGTQDSPILLTSQEESWSGIVVINAPAESIWRHATVEKMSGINRSGWVLTGGITFYQSDISLADVAIGDSTSEDALNIIRASYSFDRLEFFNTTSDAFDGDFSDGVVTDCIFRDIGGDAFDVSGSVAKVTNSKFFNIGDKAISIGEKSQVMLENLEISNVNIGIASKDLSEVYADSVVIDTAYVAGLAAYIKKPQFGPASIQATNIQFVNTIKQALCQLENEIVLNGEGIPKEDIDVEALYEQGILGK